MWDSCLFSVWVVDNINQRKCVYDKVKVIKHLMIFFPRTVITRYSWASLLASQGWVVLNSTSTVGIFGVIKH